jgi:hypothetical protein
MIPHDGEPYAILRDIMPENQDDLESTQPVDASADLDMEPFFSETGAMAEMEALTIQGILQANNIPCTVVGSSTLPVVEFVVNVPKAYLEGARDAVNEARAAGPEAAEEMERLIEKGGIPE